MKGTAPALRPSQAHELHLASSFGISAVSYSQTSERGFVRGLGGVTFGTETGAMVGGGGGVSINEYFDVIGEFGWMQNVLPSELGNQLDDLATLITLIEGVPVSLDAKVPAVYGFGGVRGNFPTGNRVTPFVEGGVGVGHITLDLKAEVLGIDISREVEEELGDTDDTQLLLAVGGGVNIAATSNVGFDVGYRYFRIFTDDPAINTSQVYGAAVFGF